jgi:ABC-type multidrug transport system ATPase subunit
MSYGQRRIIELFRVILLKPKLLCLDEPFNFLDYKNRKQIMDFLLTEDFQKETKVVMSTHYTEDTSNLNLETYYFDGNLPVKKLLNEVEFKNYE